MKFSQPEGVSHQCTVAPVSMHKAPPPNTIPVVSLYMC